jgi:hypothetical protein
MPAKKGSESKQGLIISLVCFAVLAIVLGVTTYLGYAGWGDADKQKADADKAKSTAEGERDKYKFQTALLRHYIGYPPEANDPVQAMNSRFPHNAVSSDGEIGKMVVALDESLGFDNNQNKPTRTFKDEVTRLRTEVDNYRSKYEESDRNLKKAQENYKTQIETKAAEVDEWRKKHDAAQAANLRERTENDNALDAKLKVFGGMNEQMNAQKQQLEASSENARKEKSKLTSQVTALTEANQKLKDKIAPPDPTRLSATKGHIVRLDARGDIAYIDIGSADNIRPGQPLTFSIFGAGRNGQADQTRKGSLEVVGAISEHMSEAKITEVVDPGRNPIINGDLLINPAWNPQGHEHVAIAGRIDLTGDGRDNLDEFMTNLRKQGMIIDAYLDMNDLSVKGSGISVGTNYLILGSVPEFREGETNFRLDEAVDAKNRGVSKVDTITKVADMQKDANDKGVTVVPLQKFVAMIGYRVPKGAGVVPGFSAEGRVRKAAPAAKPAEKKEPSTDEPKKDESEKQ